MTVMISNPADIKQIKDALKEISNQLTMQEAIRDQIKSIKAKLLEDQADKLTSKQLNKLARTYHKENFEESIAENEEFAYLYETILPSANQGETI